MKTGVRLLGSDAAQMTMRRSIAGLQTHEIRAALLNPVKGPTTRADFTQAILNVKKSVSASQIERYAK